MIKLGQSGFAQPLMLLLLVAGIGLGTFLVAQKTNLFPKAAENKKNSSCQAKYVQDSLAFVAKCTANKGEGAWQVKFLCSNSNDYQIIGGANAGGCKDSNFWRRRAENFCKSIKYSCQTSSPSPFTKPQPSQSTDPSFYRVFVTSKQYNGNLTEGDQIYDGLSGGDKKCQEAADSAGLGGKWKAFLNTSRVDAEERVKPGNSDGKPIKLIDGTIVADDYSNLYVPKHGINMTEYGEKIPGRRKVWTGASEGGLGDCSRWLQPFHRSIPNSINERGVYGLTGSKAATNWRWQGYQDCQQKSSLYCFEQ